MTRESPFRNGHLPADWVAMQAMMLHDEIARLHGQARRRAAAGPAGLPLLEWARKYLPAHFTRPPSSMHRWLARQLDQTRTAHGTKLNLLGPRGGAKSTVATLAHVLRAVLEGWEPYVWIVSDTRHQAVAHLENIKTELIENPRLAADYPHAAGRGSVWRSGSIVLRSGAAIDAFGTGQRIRGRRRGEHRPTLIVCDDLQNDGHIKSALQRDRSRTWFHGTLLKAGSGRTNVVNLATALHREALAMELARTPGWTSRVFRAVMRWPEAMSLWARWEEIYADVTEPNYRRAARVFYEAHRAAMDAGTTLLWPEAEDRYSLMCMRAESGHAAFEREKQNSPILPEQCEWSEAYFDETIWTDAWPERLELKVLALDPSKGTGSRRSDYGAYVLLGVDRRGVLHVEADLRREATPELVARGAELYARYRPDAFGIEANQFQELLAGQFEDEFLRRGIFGVRPWLIDNRVNKQVRIRRLGPYLASRRLRFLSGSPGTRLLVEQLKEFPVGDHDDGPDALEMAIRLAAERFGRPAVPDALGDRLLV